MSEQIDERPESLKQHTVAMGKVVFEGKTILYSLLRKEAAPRLANFVGQDKGFFFISEEVPEKFREFFLYHELYEFTKIPGKKGRCLESLKYELSLIPSELMKEYISLRKKMFTDLVTLYESLDGIDPDFVQEIKLSNAYLQEL